MTTTSTSSEPCEFVALGGPRQWYGYCEGHDCMSLATYDGPKEAKAEFVCDKGTGIRFLMAIGTHPHDVQVLDLTGLHAVTRRHVKGDRGTAGLKLWRWIADGQVEPVTLRCAERGGPYGEPEPWQIWVAEGPDGPEDQYAYVIVDLTN
ncbi:hypothetical protein ACFY05_32910 [Microtetraspora fusca]|uniref:Uncharacterized protein n=1 Tax=Microtetraspora fusca TaxID=1997 RepID=A0ABW6VIP3_MICFU